MSDHEEETSSSPVGDGAGTPSIRSEAGATAGRSDDDPQPAVAPTVEQQLEATRKLAAENYERFVRAKADLENVMKRHQRELSDRARYDGESLAREILQSVDDLERALEHKDEAASSGVSGGVELVLKGLVAALKRQGVERIDAEGKPFDPAEHEAVTMVETDEVAPGTVMAVLRAGYRMQDRLLRAAMVSVSRAPEAGSGKTRSGEEPAD